MGSMISKQLTRDKKRPRRDKRPETLHQLPEDIIEEILCNLPVKSLLRFKCVSKQWRSSISSKQFIKKQLKKKSSSIDHHKLIILHSVRDNHSFRSCSLRSLHENPNITSFDHHHIEDLIPIIRSPSDDVEYYIFRRYYGSDAHYPMMMMTTATPDDDVGGKYYPRGSFLLGILGSCNGLILISIDRGNLFIWNPTTRQVKNIVPPASYGFRDAWDNRCGYYVYGFGYDDSTDDYKIVCITDLYPKRKTITEMYSLRTNSWKKIENFDKGFMFMSNYEFGKFTSGKFVEGKLHWLTARNKEDRGCWDIVALDLAEEKYEIVGRPQYFSSHTHYRPRLHDYGGYLSLTSFDEKSIADVWVMTKYGDKESWIKFWTLRPKIVRGICGTPCPLWLTIENGDILVSFPVRTGLDVAVCNGSNVLHTSRVNIVDDPTYCDVVFEAKIYVESLVSPFGDQQL